jgi:hypothetical protein
MKTFAKLKRLLIVSFVGLNSFGCATYKVYNKEVCGDLGPYGAHCNQTLKEKTRDIPKAQWDKDRVGMLCMSSQGFTDTETVIEQMCAENPKCTYHERIEIEKAVKRVRGVAIRAANARKAIFGTEEQKLDSQDSGPVDR